MPTFRSNAKFEAVGGEEPFGPLPRKVVISDLGCSMLTSPGCRLKERLSPNVDDLYLCSPAYRAPNLCLGDQDFSADMDMWSLGCVAAEIWLGGGHLLFAGRAADVPRKVSAGKATLGHVFAFLGPPPRNSHARQWMQTLPFFKKFYGSSGQHLPEVPVPDWPPQRLQGCPRMLADFVKQTLVWKGGDRITAATAKSHPFLETPALSVRVALAPGKKGLGTICDGELAEELLQYLQECPSWPTLVASALASGFAATSKCVRSDEAKLGFKSEHVGIIDDENPPSAALSTGIANWPSSRPDAWRVSCASRGPLGSHGWKSSRLGCASGSGNQAFLIRSSRATGRCS